MKITKGKILEVVWFIVMIALFVISIKMVRGGELQSQVASFGIFAPVLIIILKMTTLVIAPLGGTPLYILSGALFGNLKGFLICLSGDILGSAACFFISRKYGNKVVRFFAGEKFFKQIQSFLSLLENTKSFLKARFALIKLPEIFAYAAGLNRVNFWKFIFIQTVFFIPIDFAFVFLGTQIATFTTKFTLFTILIGTVTSRYPSSRTVVN
jgi:uncharacterized membrane protein YdjX (TVP38/TMEM64 family)